MPHAHIYALDRSLDALTVARTNAQRHKVANAIVFLESDLMAALPKPVDLIVANPPYIAAHEWSELPLEVREYEPRVALSGGPDGLDVIRRLIGEAAIQLRPGGGALIEIGAKQGAAVFRLAHQIFPTADITIHTDLSGRDRVLCILSQGDCDGHSKQKVQSRSAK
jgi:release factor glutamine methyltransferase